MLAQGDDRPPRRRPWALGAGLVVAVLVGTFGTRSAHPTGSARPVLGGVVALTGGDAGLAELAGDLVIRADVTGAPPGTRIELARLELPGVRVDRVLAPAFDAGGNNPVRLVVAVDCSRAVAGLVLGALVLDLAPPDGPPRSVRLGLLPRGRRTIVVQAVQTRCGDDPG